MEDLSQLSFEELLSRRNGLDAEIRRRESEERAKAQKQILDLVRTHGIDLNDLATKNVSRVATGKDRKPVEAKYRHPADENLTWTGRGRKPLWVVEHLDKGGTLEELAIS